MMMGAPLCLMLACLQISPDRTQFFRYDSLSMHCEDPLNGTTWRVKRQTPQGGVRACSSGWGFSSSGSTCHITNTYPTDTGVYWCESNGGARSRTINITITDRTVILESPAMPVPEGASFRLACKTESNSSQHTYSFFKDGRLLEGNCSGKMRVRSASTSDGGSYTCSSSAGGWSEGSWVTVSASAAFPSSAPFTPEMSLPVSRLVIHLLVGAPFLLSTIILGLIYRDRRNAARIAEENHEVAMETDV